MPNHLLRRGLSLFGPTVVLVALLSVGGAPLAAQQAPTSVQPSSTAPNDNFRSRPVMFIENAGQWPEAARFQVWGGTAGTMWLAEDAIWVTVVEQTPVADSQADRLQRLDPAAFDVQGSDLPPARAVNIKLSFVDATPHPRIEPFDRLDTKVSYFIGNGPDQWRPDVPVWGGVRYVDLYPGVDLEIASEGGQMVQRLSARPGADLSAVRLRVEGTETTTVDRSFFRLSTVSGAAVLPLRLAVGTSGEAAGQTLGAHAFDVVAPFTSAGTNVTGFQPAVPTDNPADLRYSTFLGGSNTDYGTGIAVDETGNAYVTGGTNSSDFPTTPGIYDPTYNGGYWGDAYVAKVSPTGGGLIYATFLGGTTGYDRADGLAVDETGSTYMTGRTNSTDFPTTSGAFDQSYNGGDSDAFAAKLSPTGSGLVYGTFLGGSSNDAGRDLAVDGTGSAYVTGGTASSNFPTAQGGFDTSLNGLTDAFVVKLNPTGSRITFGTFVGGSHYDCGYDIAVDGSGSAYLTGETFSSDFPTTSGALDTSHNGSYDAFVVKLDPTGSRLTYGTFLGGSSFDYGEGLAVDSEGSAYVTGGTSSAGFPVTSSAFDTSLNGYYDAFAAKLNSGGSALIYSTFLGGSYSEDGHAVTVDGAGSAYIMGGTESSNFPTTPDAFDTSYNEGGNWGDHFVCELTPTGNALAYATFLGGSIGNEGNGRITVDDAGSIYVTGDIYNDNFPTTPGAFDRSYNGVSDVFVAKLAMGVAPTYAISGRVTDADGRGIPGVTVWADFPRNTTTDANGNYSFTGLPAETYTIRPEKDPYVFSPESRAVTVPPSATSVNFTGQVPIVHVKLLYVPLNWQITQAAFDAEADLQSSIFFDQVPLNACPEKYKVEKLSVAAQNFTGFTCSGDAIGSIREFLWQQGINAEDYTAVIGLAETSPCPPTGGQSNGTNTVWVTAEFDIVTAHELGHVWGLSDQYCSGRDGMSTDDRCNDGDIQGDGAQTGDVNWLDSSLPCDCPPDWSADSTGAQCCNFTTTCDKPEGCYFKGVFIAGYNQSYLRRCDSEDYGELGIVHVNYGACCLGNKTAAGGRSIMSAANAPGPRAFDTHDLAHLNTKFELNCDIVKASQTTPGESPSYLNQRILDVNLLVHQDDSVEDKRVRVTWGRPTPDSVLQGLEGDYNISILDVDGGQVWSQAFPLHFDYTGPVVLDEDYSAITYDSKDVALRIPYTCSMGELEIYHSDRLIFSRTLPTVCPIYLPLVLRHN